MINQKGDKKVTEELKNIRSVTLTQSQPKGLPLVARANLCCKR